MLHCVRTDRSRASRWALSVLLVGLMVCLGGFSIAHSHDLGAKAPCVACAHGAPVTLEAQAPRLLHTAAGVLLLEDAREPALVANQAIATPSGPRAPPARASLLTR